MSLLVLTSPQGSPLNHVVQHPLWQLEADLGALTPEGVITVLSDHIVMILAAGLLLSLFLPPLVRKRAGEGEIDRLVPTGPANLIEAICQFLRKEVAEPCLEEHTDRFIKFLWSLFFFILTLNLLGMVPLGTTTPLLIGEHIGGTATANIWVTGALALLTLLMWVINGLRIGGLDYLAHFNPGPWWLAPMMVPIEIFGTLAKTFALAVRLFANMIAGHTVLAVLLSFVFAAAAAAGAGAGLAVGVVVVLGSVAISLLELFVAVLQAYIFVFLAALFLGMSVVFHHDEGEEVAHTPPAAGEGPADMSEGLREV